MNVIVPLGAFPKLPWVMPVFKVSTKAVSVTWLPGAIVAALGVSVVCVGPWVTVKARADVTVLPL
jgi:hypothetical protein